jgi:hypothetical protein
VLQAERLLTALCNAKVEFVIIGGMAAVAHGSAYVTADLDICYQRQIDNYQRLSHVLQSFRPRLRGVSDDVHFVLDVAAFKSTINFTLSTDVGDLALIGEVAGLGDYVAVKTHAEEAELYGFRVSVLTLDGLIASKQSAGRPKDLRLLPELRALQALRNEPPKDER